MESSEKGKRNKSPWFPKRERRGRKKKEKETLSKVRKEMLAESDNNQATKKVPQRLFPSFLRAGRN